MPRLSHTSYRSVKMKIYKFEEFGIPDDLVDHEVVEDGRVEDGRVEDGDGLDEYDSGE